MQDQILDLLESYIRSARQIAQELCLDLGSENLLEGVNSGRIPRRGRCFSFGGGEYFVHGVGCRVQAAEIEIDFDFGPNGSLPGADPWKLYNFADAHAEAFPWLPKRELFESVIKAMIADGKLSKLGVLPSPNLVCPMLATPD